MSESDSHGDFERADANGRADYSGARLQQGRVPLDEDANQGNELRQRERAVSAADYERLATPGFPKVGRASVAAVFGVAALALGALLLSQIQGPRDLLADGSIDRGKLLEGGRSGPEASQGSVTAPPSSGLEPSPVPATITATAAPIEINFNADTYTIERGQCTTLRWQVSGASRITLLGSEREATGAQEVCPDQTSGYTLRAENHSDEVNEHFEIEVTEPTRDEPMPGCTPEPNDPCPG